MCTVRKYDEVAKSKFILAYSGNCRVCLAFLLYWTFGELWKWCHLSHFLSLPNTVQVKNYTFQAWIFFLAPCLSSCNCWSLHSPETTCWCFKWKCVCTESAGAYSSFGVLSSSRCDVTGICLHFCHLCLGLERSYMRRRMLKWIVSCLRQKAIWSKL